MVPFQVFHFIQIRFQVKVCIVKNVELIQYRVAIAEWTMGTEGKFIMRLRMTEVKRHSWKWTLISDISYWIIKQHGDFIPCDYPTFPKNLRVFGCIPRLLLKDRLIYGKHIRNLALHYASGDFAYEFVLARYLSYKFIRANLQSYVLETTLGLV